jgi:hypothetical protein
MCDADAVATTNRDCFGAIPPDPPESGPPAKSNGQAIAEDQTPGIPSDHASTSRQGAIKPQMTFQQRLAMERQRKDLEPSLS